VRPASGKGRVGRFRQLESASAARSEGRKGFVALLPFLVPASILAACGSNERVRYRMTVEVETPQGVKSGFAVRESIYRTPPNLPMLGEDRGGVRVKGEAVAVDLPNGDTLFALLTSAAGDEDYAARIPDRFLGRGKQRWLMSDSVTVWPPPAEGGVPLLVRFRNREDPKSIEVVDPANLEATFGTGFRLRRIAVEMCRLCSVTSGIDGRMPSYGAGSGFAEWYATLAWADPRRVGPESFRRGMRE